MALGGRLAASPALAKARRHGATPLVASMTLRKPRCAQPLRRSGCGARRLASDGKASLFGPPDNVEGVTDRVLILIPTARVIFAGSARSRLMSW
jgi:hypothetical protein